MVSRLFSAQSYSTKAIAFWIAGASSLLVALLAAGTLSLNQLAGISLPGCGPSSSCGELTAGPYGKLFGIPVSYLGFAYFSSVALIWCVTLGQLTPSFRCLILAGCLASLLFVSLMVRLNEWCWYCATAHAGNLAFGIVVVLRSRTVNENTLNIKSVYFSEKRGWLSFALTSVLTIVALCFYDRQLSIDVQDKAEAEAVAKVDEIVKAARQSDGLNQNGASTLQVTPTALVVSASSPLELDSPAGKATQQVAFFADPANQKAGAEAPASVFTGRWVQGPEKAPLRVVVFMDFQCKDCKALEQELSALAAGHDDLNVSYRHYPLCRDCNIEIKHPKFHDNACKAAYAAEVAGELQGRPGYQKMRDWILSKEGKYTEEELIAALPELGFKDTTKFTKLMQNELIQERIKEDVAQAIDLGLSSTPLVYINGIDIPGADVAGTITKVITQLREQKLTARGPENDKPRKRAAKLVQEWAEGKEVAFPSDPAGWIYGKPDAKNTILFVFDYTNPYSPEWDQQCRAYVDKHPDTKIRYLLFPLSKSLNPRFEKWTKDFYGNATDISLLAQSAWLQDKPDQFWKLHTWLLQHQQDFTLELGLTKAKELGFDPKKTEELMSAEETKTQLTKNIMTAEGLDVKWALTTFVNNKRVTAMVCTPDVLDGILGAK